MCIEMHTHELTTLFISKNCDPRFHNSLCLLCGNPLGCELRPNSTSLILLIEHGCALTATVLPSTWWGLVLPCLEIWQFIFLQNFFCYDIVEISVPLSPCSWVRSFLVPARGFQISDYYPTPGFKSITHHLH